MSIENRVRKDLALSFDDVLLLPRKSSVIPNDVNLQTRLSKKIRLNIPFMSSAMDTVTESAMAMELARAGGLGVIHKNLSIEKQAEEVRKVKKSESWVIRDPITLSPGDTVGKAREIVKKDRISSFPVVEKGKLVGILTRRDLRHREDYEEKVGNIMTKNPVTAGKDVTREQAIRILDKNKIEKLPIVDSKGRLEGLITVKDIDASLRFPQGVKDGEGRLLVAAAVGPFDDKRVRALIKEDVDIITIDTAHGHSKNVIEAVKRFKRNFDVEIIGGNVVTPEGCEELISAGADVVKVGLGPGSICTTRIVTGTGVPQITAVHDCAQVAGRHGVSIIADGGIKYSGDIAKAIAAGASVVMVGSLLAGTEEAPGAVVFYGGRKYKKYRGMGSLSAMTEGSKDRYMQANVDDKKLIPEGIEGVVPFRGAVSEVVYQMMGGLRSAMGYCGCGTIDDMRKYARFVRITKAGLLESHPHNVTITEETPNYWR